MQNVVPKPSQAPNEDSASAGQNAQIEESNSKPKSIETSKSKAQPILEKAPAEPAREKAVANVKKTAPAPEKRVKVTRKPKSATNRENNVKVVRPKQPQSQATKLAPIAEKAPPKPEAKKPADKPKPMMPKPMMPAPKPGILKIRGLTWWDVHVDGQKKYRHPSKPRVFEAGKYVIELHNFNCANSPIRKTVTIKSGERVQLKPKCEAQ